jgi:hypothetical protein
MVFLSKQERIAKRKLIRYRFRAFIRKVYLNSLWLSELEDFKFSDNVQNNINAIIMRRPAQQRGMLTIHNRRILNLKHEERSDKERIDLIKVLSELSCFKNYPPVKIISY